MAKVCGMKRQESQTETQSPYVERKEIKKRRLNWEKNKGKTRNREKRVKKNEKSVRGKKEIVRWC